VKILTTESSCECPGVGRPPLPSFPTSFNSAIRNKCHRTRSQKHHRLEGLRQSLVADPDMCHEIMEQREIRRRQEGESRPTSLDLQSVTLEEYASYVRENKGNGFSGGLSNSRPWEI
jgi:hypothetical protein